jgi:hypothetical protein
MTSKTFFDPVSGQQQIESSYFTLGLIFESSWRKLGQVIRVENC